MNALLVIALAALLVAADLDLDRGFGKAIAWRSFPAGLAEASATFVLADLSNSVEHSMQGQAADAYYPQDMVRRVQE